MPHGVLQARHCLRPIQKARAEELTRCMRRWLPRMSGVSDSSRATEGYMNRTLATLPTAPWFSSLANRCDTADQLVSDPMQPTVVKKNACHERSCDSPAT